MVKLIDHLLAARDRRNFRDLEHRPLVYILQGITPVPSAGLEWAHWFETHMDERQVGWTIVEENVSVSTVFLGVDFAHVGRGRSAARPRMRALPGKWPIESN